MNKTIIPALLLTLTAIFSSCTPKQKAQGTVEDFMKENISASYDVKSFGTMDTTRYINDSTINALHAFVAQQSYYKKQINYAKRDDARKLIYLEAKTIMNEKDTLYQTYYLTMDLKSVVAFK